MPKKRRVHAPDAMSFLTLFTANAAAAHGHEFSGPTSPSGLASCALQMLSPNTVQQSSRASITAVPPAPVSVPTVPTPIFEDIPTTPPPPPKKLPRSKTSYHLAQPPPGSHHTFKPSRSLVVQLQKLSNTTRPLPTLDVLPASVFAPRLKRKLGKFFGNGMGMQDLVFLSSEDFGHDEDDEDDEDSLSARQVVASVSSGYRKMDGEDGKGSRITVIQLSSGPQWEVSTTAAGGYEFVAHEEDGNILMARWNPKSANPRRRSYQTTKSETGEEEKKFQFSLVNPNSRKHPILGCLTKQTIEINDSYPLPSLSSPLASPAATPPHSRPGSPTTTPSPLGVAFQVPEERIMVKTSEHMRSLMLVSGIWIALREGFVASNMRLDDPSQPHYPLTPSSSLFPGGRLSPVYNRPSIAARSISDPPGGKGAFDEHIPRRPRRTGTLLAHDVTTNHHRHSAPSPGEAGSVTPPRRANSLGGAQPRGRAHSTGVLRNFGRASPVMERSRATTPETIVRVPASPTTPPTVGCINRSFKGHRHTNSVSLPNSPAKHREKQKQAASTTPSVETKKSEREKRKWGRRISGLFDALRSRS